MTKWLLPILCLVFWGLPPGIVYAQGGNPAEIPDCADVLSDIAEPKAKPQTDLFLLGTDLLLAPSAYVAPSPKSQSLPSQLLRRVQFAVAKQWISIEDLLEWQKSPDPTLPQFQVRLSDLEFGAHLSDIQALIFHPDLIWFEFTKDLGEMLTELNSYQNAVDQSQVRTQIVFQPTYLGRPWSELKAADGGVVRFMDGSRKAVFKKFKNLEIFSWDPSKAKPVEHYLPGDVQRSHIILSDGSHLFVSELNSSVLETSNLTPLKRQILLAWQRYWHTLGLGPIQRKYRSFLNKLFKKSKKDHGTYLAPQDDSKTKKRLAKIGDLHKDVLAVIELKGETYLVVDSHFMGSGMPKRFNKYLFAEFALIPLNPQKEIIHLPFDALKAKADRFDPHPQVETLKIQDDVFLVLSFKTETFIFDVDQLLSGSRLKKAIVAHWHSRSNEQQLRVMKLNHSSDSLYVIEGSQLRLASGSREALKNKNVDDFPLIGEWSAAFYKPADEIHGFTYRGQAFFLLRNRNSLDGNEFALVTVNESSLVTSNNLSLESVYGYYDFQQFLFIEDSVLALFVANPHYREPFLLLKLIGPENHDLAYYLSRLPPLPGESP